MKLMMYLGEQLIDSVDVTGLSLTKLRSQLIRETMQLLLQKHKEKLASADQKPRFFLDGVPSRIDGYESVMGKLPFISTGNAR